MKNDGNKFRVVAISNTNNDGRVLKLKMNGGVRVTVVAVSNTSNDARVEREDEILRTKS
jgi:hypothetical protein